MRRFLFCIHDATPAFARETEVMIGDLTPLLGRCLSFGVLLGTSFTPVSRRPLTFHLAQAGLSFQSFREIARLLREFAGE